MRRMFLEDFPRIGSGKGDRIKWSDSVGFITKFIYDDIEGKIEIIGYELKTQSLYIKYNDIIRKIKCYDFKKCHLASLLGKYTGEFRANIGQEFKDNKRDLVIVDRKDIKNNNETGKWYQYKCNKCSWDNG